METSKKEQPSLSTDAAVLSLKMDLKKFIADPSNCLNQRIDLCLKLLEIERIQGDRSGTEGEEESGGE